MDDKIFDQIHDVDLKKTMETSYIDYAMSECNCSPGFAGCKGWSETGTETCTVFHDRVEQRSG